MRGTIIELDDQTGTLELTSGDTFTLPVVDLPNAARQQGTQVELSFHPIGEAVDAHEARELLNHILGAV